jgi:hypothetical protein
VRWSCPRRWENNMPAMASRGSEDELKGECEGV